MKEKIVPYLIWALSIIYDLTSVVSSFGDVLRYLLFLFRNTVGKCHNIYLHNNIIVFEMFSFYK
jgi:hypothetical protein